MRSLLCIEARGWRHVIEGAARYLEEGEAIVACAIDERATMGYELAVKGLLGRRRPPDAGLSAVSEATAEQVLADAKAMLESLCPRLSASTLLIRGVPNEALVKAAKERAADAVFVGRGSAGDGREVTVSGTVSGWTINRAGDAHGLLLRDGTEVRFPPHRGREISGLIPEGAAVEVNGVQRKHHLHAYRITDAASGTSVEAHAPPPHDPRKAPLGHTARFVMDHAACDVIVLSD